jgi:hypothetical protein
LSDLTRQPAFDVRAAGQRGHTHEGGAALARERLGQHCLAASWRAVKEDALGRGEQAARMGRKQVRVEQERERLAQLLDNRLEAADVCSPEPGTTLISSDVTGQGSQATRNRVAYRQSRPRCPLDL